MKAKLLKRFRRDAKDYYRISDYGDYLYCLECHNYGRKPTWILAIDMFGNNIISDDKSYIEAIYRHKVNSLIESYITMYKVNKQLKHSKFNSFIESYITSYKVNKILEYRK